MVFSIVKQSIDIRLRLGLKQTPKLTADTECAAAIGMTAKMYGLPLPERRETLAQMRQTLREQTQNRKGPQRARQLEEILYAYEPKGAVDDEKYQLLQYGYQQEHTG